MQRLECIYWRQATQGPARRLWAGASSRCAPVQWAATAAAPAGRRAGQQAHGEPLLTFRRPSAACPAPPWPPLQAGTAGCWRSDSCQLGQIYCPGGFNLQVIFLVSLSYTTWKADIRCQIPLHHGGRAGMRTNLYEPLCPNPPQVRLSGNTLVPGVGREAPADT